jgi:hypothetical protein
MFRVLPQIFQTSSETLNSCLTESTVLSILSFTLVYAICRMHRITSMAMYVERNSEAWQCNNCSREKNNSITHSEWVSVALFTQHDKRMCHIILSYEYVACLAVTVFLHYLAKVTNFGENVIKYKMCVCFPL